MTDQQHDLNEGRWALIASGAYATTLRPALVQIVKSSARRVVANQPPYTYDRHFDRAGVVATFANREDAEKLKQSLAGVEGEMTRRIGAARDAANQQADALIRKATS